MTPRRPPPAAIASPLMATPRGGHRKADTAAAPRAVTSRPIDTASGPTGGTRSVTVGPGCTTVTLMPDGPSSSARFFVSAATATLRTLPTIEPVWRVASPLTLTIRPHFPAAMYGAAARAQRR